MKTTFEKIKQNLMPIALFAVIAGAAQDLLFPLVQLGIKAGVAVILLGIVILAIPKQSGLGQKIKDITDNWKTPLVISLLSLGTLVLIAAVITEQSKEEKGYLAGNFEALKTLQTSLLGLEKEVAETKVLVKENLEVSSKTLENTDEIIKNTRKNAYEELTARGLQINDELGLVGIVKNSSLQEFKEVMGFYKDANFNVLKEVQMPDMVTANSYNSNTEKALAFFTPSTADLLNALLLLKTDMERFQYIIELFNVDIDQIKSPVSTGYARMKYSQTPWDSILPLITHPQIMMATGEDINFSLISHKLNRENKLTDKRGGYTPLHYISLFGFQSYLEPLLALGFDINGQSHTGYTPLALALEHGQVEMAKLLLKNGADIRSNDSIAIEIALIKALAYNNAHASNGTVEVSDNIYFDFVTKHGGNSVSSEIRESVTDIYKKYHAYEIENYSYNGPSKKAITYSKYIDWIKQL